MKITLKNGYLISPEKSQVEKKNIYIKDGKIFYEKPFDKADREIDLKNKIIFPGLVNAHHHIYSCLSKGIPCEVPFENFSKTLKNLWWTLDKSLDKESTELSTVLTVRDSIKNGVTTIFDHHISASYIENSLSTMANIFEDHGIAGTIAFETSDRYGNEIFEKMLEENARFAKENVNKSVKGMIGLHAAFTLSDESLRKIAEKTENFPIHIHIAEGNIDEEQSYYKYNKSIIERLDDFDLLRDNSLLIHCSNVSQKEIDILKKKNVFIAQAIDSNMNNALNIGNVHKFVENNLPTTVGTDGMTSSIMKAYKNSLVVTKYLNQNPDIGFSEMDNFLKTSYKLKKAFGFPLGTNEGEISDLAIFDYQPATKFDSDSFLGHMIFGITEARAQYVIKNGEFLLDNYEITNQNYKNLTDNAIEISEKLFKRFEKNKQ